MPRNHASLQRRPFLTPIWLTILGAFLTGVVLIFFVWVWGTADSTIVILVRHAEKVADGDSDPPLTAAGAARAALLSRMFAEGPKGSRIDAIYVSPALRNRMTAAPLAARLGLTPVVAQQDDARAFARRVLHEHPGGRILVVGHGDTLPDILEALGAARVAPMADQDYGTLYIVSVPRIGRTNELRVDY